MRSLHARIPPDEGPTVTGPQQVGVSFAAHRGVVLERDGRAARLDIRPGDVFANGRDHLYWSEVAGPDEVVEIYPDAALLRAAAGTSRTPEIEPLAGARDAVVLAVASTLKRAHLRPGSLGDVAASELAHRLAAHLVTYYGGRRASRPPTGCLDRVQLDRVAALVEDRLGDPLTVADLAAAATLSPFHFARSFRLSTGMAPHEFVTSRRLDRATLLLRHTTLSVAEVAYAVGYSNVGHFRRLFRRHTGILPAAARSR
ncbi:AraC family transcriptional regulator [Prauserella shujinwangii]|uniref:AraC family transcriptional regulator n=2 Tax=Prauserella shujinwangii TaxID=1453103 RepID=A0A2T0LYD4_9PSEU|nr:AraC family transcriptional regulator [Prauserella shujinwangii]